MKTDLSTRLRRVTGDAALRPLVVLALLFFFDEFDSAAFNVLAPNIRHAFNLTNKGFGLVVIVNLTIVLGLAVPLGHLADRRDPPLVELPRSRRPDAPETLDRQWV